MSARKLLALLVVVMLGLLLICPTALARPEMPLQDVNGGSCTIDPDEDDEPGEPELSLTPVPTLGQVATSRSKGTLAAGSAPAEP